MDTITHGIAGALIGKALFKGDDLFAMRAMNRQRIVSWSMMLGAIFPDSDTFRDMLSHNELLMITWHRSVTHSLLCLPIFALLLAAVTRWIARWRKWDAPSFAALTGIYALGIFSHIVLDLVTSFGTMVWSPWKWSRPAWDLIFIVDFTFTGILLLPQVLAWVHERPEKSRRRALVSLAIFILGVFAVQAIGNAVGAPISSATVFLFDAILAALFLLPLRLKTRVKKSDAWVEKDLTLDANSLRGEKVRRLWNLAGLAGACAYLALAIFAHGAALDRVKNFAIM
ncbi:MAG: metal-dependent hydrolase, partial [Candidatus Acidiferrum sp.]